MKLTILGNNGPYPCAGGACSGYLLSDDSDSTHVLLDCGTGVLANLSAHISIDALDAVILTHLHFDHMSDLLPMQYALQFNPRPQPLPVYAPQNPTQIRALLDVPAYALNPMSETTIGKISFCFFPVRHPVECFALRACCDGKTFVYTGDTNSVPGLADFARNADVLLADSGLLCADWTENAPHLSPKGCAQLAADANAKRLLLTHLNPRHSAAEHEAEAGSLRSDARFVRIGESLQI